MLRRSERVSLPKAALWPGPLDGAFPGQSRPEPHKREDVRVGGAPRPLHELSVEDVEALDVLVVLFGGEHDVEGELVRPAVLASDDPGEVREEDRLAGA
jgi:hypothetical protein